MNGVTMGSSNEISTSEISPKKKPLERKLSPTIYVPLHERIHQRIDDGVPFFSLEVYFFKGKSSLK